MCLGGGGWGGGLSAGFLKPRPSEGPGLETAEAEHRGRRTGTLSGMRDPPWLPSPAPAPGAACFGGKLAVAE